MRRAAVLLLSALCAASATTAAAQQRGTLPSLTRAEILGSGAPDLYSAVATLRPAWLAAVGDTLYGDGFDDLVVYLNGRHAGDVRLLRTMPAGVVAGIRYVSADYIRSVDPRYPRHPFTAALWVATRTADDHPVRHARRTVAVYAVGPVLGMRAELGHGLSEAGYRQETINTYSGVYRVKPDAPPYAPGVGVSATLGLTRALGVEAQAEHVLPASVGRFGPRGAVAATFASTDATLLATYRRWPGRLGAGVIVRRGSWEWGEGICACYNRESGSSTGYGVAAAAATLVPIRTRMAVEARVGLRYFLSHEAPGYRDIPPLDVSGAEGVISFGLALHR